MLMAKKIILLHAAGGGALLGVQMIFHLGCYFIAWSKKLNSILAHQYVATEHCVGKIIEMRKATTIKY